MPLIVMDRKRLGDVGRRPKKLLPDDAALRWPVNKKDSMIRACYNGY